MHLNEIIIYFQNCWAWVSLYSGYKQNIRKFELKYNFLTGNDSSNGGGKKFCILVTQSTPLHHPWLSASSENIIKNFKSSNIKLSILASHRLPELYRIFEMSGGDLSGSTNKNYCTKPQHTVLLAGFTLPEHDNPPLTNTSAATGQTTTGVASQSQTPQQQMSPAGGHMNPSPQQPVSNSGAASPASLHQQQQAPQQQMRMPNMNQQGNMAAMSRSNVGKGLMRPAGMNSMAARPQRWPMNTNQQQDPNKNMNPQQQMANPQQQMAQSTMQQQSPQQTMQQPQQQQQQQGLNIPNISGVGAQQQRTVVWQGTLELQEKKDGSSLLGRASHQVPCKMTASIINGEPEVKADGWPSNLVLHLIPKSILSHLGNSYFKQVHTVMFLPEPCPALTILTNNLSRSMVSQCCMQVQKTLCF